MKRIHFCDDNVVCQRSRSDFCRAGTIIGAFLAGLALNRYILEHGPLMNRIKFVGNALFIPFFLLSVGMLMDVRLFIESPESWALAGGMILLLPIGKWLAVYFSSKLFHFNKTEEKVMFGLSVPQAAATLAATLVGYDLGLFDQTTVNGVIFMILITCMIGPYVVEKYGRQMALNEEVSFSRTKQDAGRVLIPLSQTTTTTTDALLDLAFLLRTQHSTEHVYALHVVQDQGKPDAKRLAEAEKMLGHAIVYGAAAEVPVQILTPVDANVAAGIERASQEKSIDTILLEWKAETSTESKMFGRKLDQILDLTQQHLIVSKFAHPINTVNKLVLLLPPGSDHQSGFMESVITIKRLAAQLSAQIEVLVVKDKKKRFEGIISGAEPQVTFDMKEADSWEEVLEGPFRKQRKIPLLF
nr:cation:proton antiporter [Thalassobacillus sp. C254]